MAWMEQNNGRRLLKQFFADSPTPKMKRFNARKGQLVLDIKPFISSVVFIMSESVIGCPRCEGRDANEDNGARFGDAVWSL